MDNMHKYLEAYFQRVTGKADYHIPDNIQITYDATRHTTVMTIKSILADPESDGMAFESWLVLLQGPKMTEKVEFDISEVSQKLITRYLQGELNKEEKEEEKKIQSFIYRINLWQKMLKDGTYKLTYKFPLSKFLRGLYDSQEYNINHNFFAYLEKGYSLKHSGCRQLMSIHRVFKDFQIRKESHGQLEIFEGFKMNIKSQKPRNKYCLPLDIDGSVVINSLHDIGKMFLYFSYAGRMARVISGDDGHCLFWDMTCNISAGVSHPLIDSCLQDAIMFFHQESTEMQVNFIEPKLSDRTKWTREQTRENIEHELQIKTGIVDLRFPQNFSLQFVPDIYGPKLIMTLEKLEGDFRSDLAFKAWRDILQQYLIAIKIELNFSKVAIEEALNFLNGTEEEQEKNINIGLFLYWLVSLSLSWIDCRTHYYDKDSKEYWQEMDRRYDCSASKQLINILQNSCEKADRWFEQILQRESSTNKYICNLQKAKKQLSEVYYDQRIVLDGGQTYFQSSFTYEPLQIGENLEIKMVAHQRRGRVMQRTVLTEEEHWRTIWEINKTVRIIVQNIQDYAEGQLYVDFIEQLATQMFRKRIDEDDYIKAKGSAIYRPRISLWRIDDILWNIETSDCCEDNMLFKLKEKKR